MNSPNHALAETKQAVVDDGSIRPLGLPSVPVLAAGDVRPAVTLASYLELPFIHKRLILICTLLGVLCGWVAILVWPRTYQSEAKLIIRVGRESVSLDPTATTSATLMLQKTQEEEVFSALEVLNSQRVAETVVDRIGENAVLDGILPDAPGKEESSQNRWLSSTKRAVADGLFQFLRAAGIKDDISNRELAVREVQDVLRISSPKKSSVIIIDARAKTPEMAQAIVQEVSDSFLNEHLNAAYTSGSREFFEKQSAEIESQLNELVAERANFMRERKIVSIDANRNLLEQQLSGIDRDLVVAVGELEQATSEIEDLKMKVAGTEDEIIASKSQASAVTWSGMRQRIYNLELDVLRLAAIYSSDHPQLQAVREELEGAQQILTEFTSERMDTSTTPNPAKTRLHEQLQTQQTRIVGLQSVIEQKQKQRAEMEGEVSDLLESERVLVQLDRNVRLMDGSLQILREKLEESRVIDELHAKKISNVHVFQPATLAERPVSPKKPLLGAGFLLLGLTSGLVLSLFRQINSTSLRTKEDVECKLGVPVVATIPRLRRMESLRLKDQKLYRNKCQGLIAEILLSPRRQLTVHGRSIAIMGVDSGAGASTLAANLAVTGSVDCRMRTILVDADSRQRSLSKMFGLNGAPGLVELMNGNASHDECLQRAKNASVDLIASAADSCEQLLTASAPEIVQALQAYQADCDLLIVDLPAASQPDQAVVLAQHLDCVLVVVESEETDAAAAERLLRHLYASDTEVIGVVLNKTRSYLPKLIRRFVAPQV